MKRTFDIFVSTIGLLVLWPLMALIALAIKCSSAGPIYYHGIRTGKHGETFRILKFRTMVDNAEQLGGFSTGRDDPRVTGIGRFLRKHKLDELPQLINVLRGEMSIVGPRTEMPAYTDEYEGEEQLMLTVRPGIADYASIKYANLGEILGNEDPDRVYEEKIRPIKNQLRVKYVKEQSFLGDIRIILQTLLKLLKANLWNTSD